MIKRIHILLCAVVLAFVCACESPVDPNENTGQGGTVEESGAGSCVPIMVPNEFIFLSWYELINIYSESFLDELRKPGALWRMAPTASQRNSSVSSISWVREPAFCASAKRVSSETAYLASTALASLDNRCTCPL